MKRKLTYTGEKNAIAMEGHDKGMTGQRTIYNEEDD